MKSNLANPHYRTITIENVYNLLFQSWFKDDHHKDFYTLYDLAKDFEYKSLLKFHLSGDISFITPWDVVDTSIKTEEELPEWTCNNSLVIPLKSVDGDKKIECFFPCNGFDLETDELPVWAEDVNLGKLFPNFCVKDFSTLRKRSIRGKGTLSATRGENWTSIKRDQVQEGNWIVCRGDWFPVELVIDDGFAPLNSNNVSSRSFIRMKTNFKHNHKKQSFDIVSEPAVKGTIITVPKANLKHHEPTTVTFNAVNQHDFGNVKISFKNACFNSCGFLTHDTHIL